MDTPAPLSLFLVANTSFLSADDPVLLDGCSRADLVVSLGGVDLTVVAQALPPRKPALCVLSPEDSQQMPRPFRVLHGSGFSFRDWQLAGLSGAAKLGPAGGGLYLADDEAEALLFSLPAADIFFSHAYPTDLAQSGINSIYGMKPLDSYLRQNPPIYHFYAHPTDNTLEEGENHLSVGVNGTYLTPPLEYI